MDAFNGWKGLSSFCFCTCSKGVEVSEYPTMVITNSFCRAKHFQIHRISCEGSKVAKNTKYVCCVKCSPRHLEYFTLRDKMDEANCQPLHFTLGATKLTAKGLQAVFYAGYRTH